jgi:hypothetical protein
MSITSRYTVRSIDFEQSKQFLLKIHYAKRLPNHKKCFGLFNEELILCGVCVLGTAPSSFWNNGGKLFNNKHIITVYELNRLCVLPSNEKNLTSYFVSQCLKQIPRPNVVISYADIDMNHCGYIYQACNFIYCGISKPMCKSKNYIYNGKKYHGRTMNKEKIKKLMQDNYNENIDAELNFLNIGTVEKHIGKHRYIFINAKNKKQLIKDMIFESQTYPKTININYEINQQIVIQHVLF